MRPLVRRPLAAALLGLAATGLGCTSVAPWERGRLAKPQMALDRDFRARGLEVVAVNLDEEPEEAQAFLARHAARFEQAADPTGRCPRDFGVETLPSSYLVDRRGVIRHVHRGFRESESEKLRALVESLLAEDAAPEMVD